MCKPTVTSNSSPRTASTRLLLSLDSFHSKHHGEGPPGFASCFVTGILVVAFLTAIEHGFRYFFATIQDQHPILEDETNRHILARHLGVDAFSCLMVSTAGWFSRHVCKDVLSATFYGNKAAMPDAGHEERLYTYHPAGFRVALFFFFYQVKNLHDTIVWNDGPEFIFHHVFSLITAWGSMTPGCGHYYGLFFFGMSEISTGILCILANFDDEHGVPGLGDAMPMTKVALGGIFVFWFITCRCILWPIFSRYFVNDCLLALKGDDHRTKTRRGWLRFFLISLSGLSVLQIAWLGQIFVLGKQELTKVGLI